MKASDFDVTKEIKIPGINYKAQLLKSDLFNKEHSSVVQKKENVQINKMWYIVVVLNGIWGEIHVNYPFVFASPVLSPSLIPCRDVKSQLTLITAR